MRLTRNLLFAILICTIVSVTPVMQAQTGDKDAKTVAPASLPKINFKEVKLKNGLRVFLVENHRAPVISLALIYDAGLRNERKGLTGFAHLFEHMMFQGSENIGKSEHFILVDTNGGNMNGTTNEERTLYFETLPANQLDLLLFLEADRMRSLDISKENLDNQRNAVQEERRLRLDNQAYGKFQELFGETVYDNFAYKHSVIGSMDDLNAASVNDVREFFRIYYAPNNAIMVLVGDFKTNEAIARIKKQFEPIPAQPAAAKVDAAEPAQTAERRFTVEDPLAQLSLLLMAYKGVAGNTQDAAALQVMVNVIGSGQSSRLYQKLVREKQLVINIGSFVNAPGPRGSTLQCNDCSGKESGRCRSGDLRRDRQAAKGADCRLGTGKGETIRQEKCDQFAPELSRTGDQHSRRRGCVERSQLCKHQPRKEHGGHERGT
ncbi:MAG: insulinase family protein [Acidobacteria bacterium]|nr:insulinase family protein [Acidobacteriota bacterium]